MLILFIGNKVDLVSSKAVDSSEAKVISAFKINKIIKELAEKYKAIFYEVSAKDATGVS